MVLTRSRSKRNKTKTGTTTANTSAATQINQTENVNDENEEDKEKALENLKLVASLVDWSSYDAIAGKIFYQKFGRTLEKKVEEFEQTKKELKAMIREACGNVKALQTPKKVKPAAALQEQINRYKALNFDSDDDDKEGEEVEETVTLVPATPTANEEDNTIRTAVPIQSSSVQQLNEEVGHLAINAPEENAAVTVIHPHPMEMSPEPEQQISQNKRDEIMTTPMDQQNNSATVQSTPVTPLVKKQKLGTPYYNPKLRPLQSSSSMKKLAIAHSSQQKKMPPVQMPPLFVPTSFKGTPSKEPLNTTIQKKAKLKEIDEKVELAKKAREVQLKEKAERAKREAEERRRRVEQNKKQQEQERIEKEARAREQQEIVRKFVAEQKKQQQQLGHPPTSPFRVPAGPPKKPMAGNAKGVEKQQTPPKSPIRSPQLSPILADHDEGNVEEDEPLEEVSAYELTMEKIPLPSTKDNYNVDDLSSGDETDNDEQPKKTVPSWAQKDNIVARIQAIRKLVPNDHIERHFGRIRQPTVQEFFTGYNKKYPQRRQSSATWNSPMSDPTPGVGRFQNMLNKKDPKAID